MIKGVKRVLKHHQSLCGVKTYNLPSAKRSALRAQIKRVYGN